MKKSILHATVTFFALSFAVAVAQDATQDNSEAAPSAAAVTQGERLTIETRDRETPAMRGLRVERQFQRRLPNNFAPLVNAAQREEIYQIQADYHELLTLLEMRIELLRNERDARIEGVLTPAQLERLRQTRPNRRQQ